MNYFSTPGIRYQGSNINALLKPIMSGISEGRQRSDKIAEQQRQQANADRQFGLQRESADIRRQQFSAQQQQQQVQQLARQAARIRDIGQRDPQAAISQWGVMLQGMPQLAPKLAEYGVTPEDWDQATGFLLAEAGQYGQQGPEPTAGMREYEMARRQGFQGSLLDYKAALARAGRSETNVSVGAGETSYDKELGKQLVGEYIKAQEVGGKAATALADLSTMQEALANPNVYTGTGGNAVQALKKAASTLFGVDIKGVADAEIIERTSKKIALGMKDNLPGPMSNSDRDFLVNLPAGLTTSPEGARRIVALGIAQKQWEIERANAVRQYAVQNGGRLDSGVYAATAAVDQRWASQMSSIVRELRAQPQEPRRAPSAGVPMDALRQRYGLER